MPMRIRQLQRDVNEREEAELRHLEGGSQVGGDAMHSHVLVAQPVQAEGGAVVSGAAQRAEQLSSKLFANGGFRDSAKIVKLLPRGGAGLQERCPGGRITERRARLEMRRTPLKSVTCAPYAHTMACQGFTHTR